MDSSHIRLGELNAFNPESMEVLGKAKVLLRLRRAKERLAEA